MEGIIMPFCCVKALSHSFLVFQFINLLYIPATTFPSFSFLFTLGTLNIHCNCVAWSFCGTHNSGNRAVFDSFTGFWDRTPRPRLPCLDFKHGEVLSHTALSHF